MPDIETPTDVLLKKAKIAEAEAQTRLYRAQATKAEMEHEAVEMQLSDLRETDVLHRASDHAHRVYRFVDVVNAGTARACIAKLAQWDRIDPTCPIEVIFNSPGGSVIEGMAVFDELVALSERGEGSHYITVGTRGMAASMAGILLQAGDHRWIGRQSTLMIHEISAQTGGKIGDLKDDIKYFEATCARVVDIFIDRAQGKISKEAFIHEWERTNWWLSAEKALQYGFVDQVKG